MKTKDLNIGHTMTYKAKLLKHSKSYKSKNKIIEIKVWRIPKDEFQPKGLKFSYTFIVNNKRVFAIDNYERKRPHIHLFGKEKRYNFTTIKDLEDYFFTKIEEIEKELGKDDKSKGN